MKGIVCFVWRKKNSEKEFLLLHRVLHWAGWEFPKGSIEKKETFETAVKRELSEEIGLNKIARIKKLRYILRFFDPIRKCNREMHGFLIEVLPSAKVSIEQNIEKEHDAFEWVDAQTVLEKLTFEDQKRGFGIALKSIGK